MEKYQKKFIDLTTGERYAYIDQGRGDKVILLLHGNMSSSLYYYDFLARMKEEEGYRLIAPDLRGFGDSSYHNRFSSFDDLADDLVSFLDKLEIKKVLLVGWSAGAGVGLRLIVKKPGLVEKFVHLNGASYRGYPIFKKDATFKPVLGSVYTSKDELALDPVQVLPMINAFAGKQKAFVDYVYGLTIFNVKKPDQADLDLLFEETLKQRNLVDFDWSLASLNMSGSTNLYHSGTNDIHLVDIPVLLLWGAKDQVVLEYMVRETHDALASSELLIYPNASHALLLDEPERFKADVLNFFNQ